MELIDTTHNNKTLFPDYTIVRYKNNSYDSSYKFQYHKIVNGNLCAGQPLTFSTAKNIFKSINIRNNSFEFKGIIPNSILSINQNSKLSLTWFVRPQKRFLYFNPSTNINSGLYPLPKLIFNLNGTNLKVFAINRNSVISEDSILCFAPFLNVSNKGHVCMGTAALNYTSFTYIEDIIAFVEKQFFSSVFNATHNNSLTKGNVIKNYKMLLNQTHFNDNILNESKITLSKLL